MSLTFGSVCSGIEAASVAWNPLGWRAAFLSEIEAFPRALLTERHGAVPLHGDFTTIQAGQYDAIDLLVGGTPCQSFSVAGLRGGLADERGNLALEYLRLAERLQPRWLVWENVPGVLSSGQGRDFGAFLGGLGQLGYGFAYRVLDAQFFGLAQRRKRVFVVGYLGDWRRAAAVLFEPASLRGDPPPRRAPGQGVANCLTDRADRGGTNSEGQRLVAGTLAANGRAAGSATSQDAHAGMLISHALNAHGGPHGRMDAERETFVVAPPLTSNPYGDHESREGLLVANPLGAKKDGGWRGDLDNDTYVSHSLRASGFDASEDGTGRGTPLVPIAFGWQNSASQGASTSSDHTPTLDKSKTPAIAFMKNQRGELYTSEQTNSLTRGGGKPGQGYQAVTPGSAVRRLTPRECERLQGFPDDYTAITYRGRPAADGPRYRALGNSMAVPCMAWIGRRIAAQHTALQEPA